MPVLCPPAASVKRLRPSDALHALSRAEVSRLPASTCIRLRSNPAAVWVLCAFDLLVLYLVSTLAQVCLGGGIEGIFSSFFACVLDLIPMAVLILFFALINQLVKGSSLTVLLCVVCYVALVVFGTYMPSVGGLVFTGYLRWHNLWIGVTLPFLSLLPRIGLLAGYGLVFGCGGYLLFDRKEA